MIYLGADKHGYKAIKIVELWLKQKQIPFENIGVRSEKKDLKLENLLPAVAASVKSNQKNVGIVSCGTGIGTEVGINKFGGIRACLIDDSELARWSKIYDNCNVLCLVGWRSDKNKIEAILEAWFSAKYDGNKDRLKMIEAFNHWH
jgi:ribose 5-phosphate isomerase B